MGSFVTKVFDAFSGVKKGQKLLLLGLDGAGKTTIMNQLQLNENVHTVPTIGFNCETIKYKNIEFTFWDIGGQDKIRKLWRHYFEQTNCLCFVVDSSDEDRLNLAKETLENVLADEALNGVPVLVFANKQDVSNKTVNQIAQALDLNTYRNREWYIQPACAINGSGLYEGFDWVAKQLKKK